MQEILLIIFCACGGVIFLVCACVFTDCFIYPICRSRKKQKSGFSRKQSFHGDDSDGSSSGDEFEDPFVSWDLYRNVEHKSRDQQSGEIVYVNNVYNSKYTISKPKKPASSQKSAQTPEVSSDNLFDLQTTLPSQSSERDESMKQKQLTFPSNLLPSIPYNFASLTLEDVELQLTCSAKNGDINLDNESGQTTNETEEESSMTRISTDDKDDKLDHDSFPRFSQRFEFIQNNQSRNNTSLQVFNIQNHQFSFRDEENPQQQLPESRKVERRVTDLVPKSQQWLTVKKKGYYYKPKHKYSSNNLYKRPPIAVNLLSKTNSKSPEKNEFIDFDRLEKGVNNNYDLKISESLYLEELRHCSQSELYFKLLLNKTNNASLRESMALSIRHLPPRIAAIVDAVATRDLNEREIMRLRRYVAALTVENKKLSSAKQQHAQRFDVRI